MSKNIIYSALCIFLSGLLNRFGMLFWKFFITGGINNYLMIIIGFIFFFSSLFAMLKGFEYGEISILYPMLSTSYIISLVIGIILFDENITISKGVGIILIIIGTIFLGKAGSNNVKQ